jgi:hypothetical protein
LYQNLPLRFVLRQVLSILPELFGSLLHKSFLRQKSFSLYIFGITFFLLWAVFLFLCFFWSFLSVFFLQLQRPANAITVILCSLWCDFISTLVFFLIEKKLLKKRSNIKLLQFWVN